jgi:hypothetical protein
MRLCIVVALGILLSACSDQGSAQDANAPVKIEMSQMYITVRNNSGLALNDVSLVVIPVGRSTVYNKFIGRIENASSANVMLGELVGRDGTPFSLRVAKPNAVEVKGKDVNGKEYAVKVPWQN